MNALDREVAAKCLYEADLDLNDTTTVKQVIDLMITYGHIVAREYYRTGVSDAVLNRVSNNLLCEEVKNRKNPSSPETQL